MSVDFFARIPDELFEKIINDLGDHPTDVIKVGLASRWLSQRLDALLWSQLKQVENLVDGGCRFFTARRRLQVSVDRNSKNADNIVKYIVQMSINLTSITTKNSFDHKLTKRLLDHLGQGEQQLNNIVLSSCVSDTDQAISLLKRNRPYLETIEIDGGWGKVPVALSGIGCNQILDHLTISFAGQQLSGQGLQQLFSRLSSANNTRISKLSLNLAYSNLNGRSKFVKKAWSHFATILQERRVECLTITGSSFDLLKIKEPTRKVSHSITNVRIVDNIWSLDHSLQDWLEAFPQLNGLHFKLDTTCGDKYFPTINNDRSQELNFDSSLILSTESQSIIRGFIPFNADITVEVQLDRLTNTTFVLSISRATDKD